MATQRAFVTTTDEDRATEIMRSRNRTSRRELWVLVDGPGEGQYTVMPLDDAIDSGFKYRWEC